MEIVEEALSPSQRKPKPDNLVFGKTFTDHMFTQWYTPDKGWHDAKIGPYQSITLDPASAVLHYGQEIFEGTKAYKVAQRPGVNLFRPMENMHRFNESARRMAMPEVDKEEHLEAIVRLLTLDYTWVPTTPGSSLYIRPVMIAIDPALGVHASDTYLHYIILAPVGAYFTTGFNPVAVYISHEYVRAVRGGTGEAKTGGNYAASLLVSEEVRSQGYQQVLWLDGVERRYVEEVGAMNIAFVYNGRHLVTPPLTGSILPGVTRDSVLRLAPDLGYTVSETALDVNDMLADVRSGEITEIFGMGTAAVIAPVGKLGYKAQSYLVNNNEPGPVSQRLYKILTDIQYGRVPDPYGWTYTIYPNGSARG